MPGPPPQKNARRANARPDWRRLPAAGREGAPPDFPLGKPTKPVASLWAELWSSPQAVAWNDLGWTRVVARYCKLLLAAEKPGAPTSLLGEVRQLEDRLGLTPMSMKRLQWEIETQPAGTVAAVPEVLQLDEYRQLYGSA